MFRAHDQLIDPLDESFDSEISEPRATNHQVNFHTMQIQNRPSLVQVKGSARFTEEQLENMRKELLENKKAQLSFSIKNHLAQG
jgi:hypothetical protein